MRPYSRVLAVFQGVIAWAVVQVFLGALTRPLYASKSLGATLLGLFILLCGAAVGFHVGIAAWRRARRDEQGGREE